MKNEYLEIILDKMFDMVNADKGIDIKKPDWFLKHEWTEKEQDDFLEWLKNFLLTNKDARMSLTNIRTKDKRRIEAVASEFVFNYGWKTKE